MNSEQLKKAQELEKQIGRTQTHLDKLSVIKTGYMINREGYWLALKADNNNGEALNEMVDEHILDACKSLICANIEKKLLKLKDEFEKL